MKYYISLILLLNAATPCLSQRGKFITNSTISGTIGTATYYGDLSPYKFPFRGLLKSSSFNTSLSYTREISERRAHNLTLHFTELRGSDFKYNQNSKVLLTSHQIRGLHFRNQSWQIEFQEKIYLIENQSTINRRKNNFLPYLSSGIGLLYNHPTARDPYDVKLGNWRSLRALNTQGNKKKYSLIVPFVPLSIGFHKKINRRFDFKFQGNINYCFSDFLDDVSGTPYLSYENFENPKAYIFHNRINEPFDALTGQDRKAILLTNSLTDPVKNGALRGSNSSYLTKFDTFITTEFGINYWLDWKIK
jgi:hypothetical protein